LEDFVSIYLNGISIRELIEKTIEMYLRVARIKMETAAGMAVDIQLARNIEVEEAEISFS
jgi:hypothetical protein